MRDEPANSLLDELHTTPSPPSSPTQRKPTLPQNPAPHLRTTEENTRMIQRVRAEARQWAEDRRRRAAATATSAATSTATAATATSATSGNAAAPVEISDEEDENVETRQLGHEHFTTETTFPDGRVEKTESVKFYHTYPCCKKQKKE